MLALGVPSSSFKRMVPAVAVYLISCPPIFTNASSEQLSLRVRAASFLLSAFPQLYPAVALAAARNTDLPPGEATRRKIESEGNTSWVAGLLLMHAKNTNLRRAASYARARAASIASECPPPITPAIPFALLEIAVRMRPTNVTLALRSAACAVLAGPPPFYFSFLLPWRASLPEVKHSRKRICHTLSLSRN